jgi:predicted DNA-binding transcriptional regulator YafY
MPASKRAYSRYHIIDRCLSSHTRRYWSAEALMARLAEHDLEIHKRTLLLDIHDMRNDLAIGYLAPIEFCKINKGYYYSNESYSIKKLLLNQQQIRALLFALTSARQYIGTKLVTELHTAVDAIMRLAHGEQAAGHIPSVHFEQAYYAKGMEHLDALQQAIEDQSIITISYAKFIDEAISVHTFHPYLLKEYRNRWYVLGYSVERQQQIVLALDRIDSLYGTNLTFTRDPALATADYFEHVLGVTVSHDTPEYIVLQCTPLLGKYLKTQYLHHSQQVITDTAEGVVIGLELIINYELIGLLMSYGKDIKVLAPDSLQRRIKNYHQQAADQYTEGCLRVACLSVYVLMCFGC